MTTAQIGEDVARIQEQFNSVRAEVGKVLVGQEPMVQRLLMALLADAWPFKTFEARRDVC